MNKTNVDSCVVRDKVDPIFQCKHVKGTETEKVGRDGEKYLAIPKLNDELVQCLNENIPFKVTAKVDGTSTLVLNSTLLKRRDRKNAWDKRQKKMIPKKMPNSWIQTGVQTDSHGVGYMPLEKGDTWFFDVFERDVNPDEVDAIGHPLINGKKSTRVRVVKFKDSKLVYEYVDLSDLNGKSFELLGPKIQSNPHGLKFHALMEHGLIECKTYPLISTNVVDFADLLQQIKEFHNTDPLGIVIEGTVLHFKNGKMFKLHRHHLDLEWSSNIVAAPLFGVVE